MTEPADRLREARIAAGYSSATEAAKAFGWTVSTYLGHENGSRGLNVDAAQRYGRGFRVPWSFLLTGQEFTSEAGSFGVPVVGSLGFTTSKLADPDKAGSTIPVGAEGYGFDELIAVHIHPGPVMSYLIVCTDPKQPILYYDEVLVQVTDDEGLRYGTVIVSEKRPGAAGGYMPAKGWGPMLGNHPISEAEFLDLPGLKFEGIVVAAYEDRGRRKAIENIALRNMR